MAGLNLFRNARIVLLPLLLLLLCTACAPAASIKLGARSPALVARRPGVEIVDYKGDGAQSELPALAPGETRLYATQIALPTYPIEGYEAMAFDPVYRWPYLRFN